MNRTKYQVTYYHNQRQALVEAPTPKIAARWAYRRIKKRIKESPYYKEFSAPSQDELEEFYTRNWEVYMALQTLWVKGGCLHGDTPSLDRVDPSIGYELANLRIVPQRENSRLSVKYRVKTKPTHCPAGHEYNGKNTGINRRGSRFCRNCNREKALKSYHKNKSL